MIDKKNRILHLCWFSDFKTMSYNRKLSLKILYKTSGVNINLITNKNFYQYENLEIPIHKGFQYLSDVHKSAYTRCYMMYFFGGGYSDIKPNSFDWNKYFDKLYLSEYDAAGYRETRFEDIVNFWEDSEFIKKEVENNYFNFAGNGLYIYKPKTKIARLWLEEVHKKLDYKFEDLKKYPGTFHPYAITGGLGGQSEHVSAMYKDSKYPIEWGEINGKIIQRLQYENNFSNFLLNMPRSNSVDYR